MPTIAIAPCSALGDYEEAVRAAGGTPRILDLEKDTPDAVVAAVDGLVLTGGNDILPSLYGEAQHTSFVPSEAGRDAWELELSRLALDADLPMLAICRGVQVLNVARGGTLVQDIPTTFGTSTTNHNVVDRATALAHEVRVAPGSLLERLLRTSLSPGLTISVNSRHHQAPGVVGTGLVVVGTAPDGVIEAMEEPTRRFCLGLQWHAENFWRTGEFNAVFEGLVSASRR
jgi:putative glutamine amidotransferase